MQQIKKQNLTDLHGGKTYLLQLMRPQAQDKIQIIYEERILLQKRTDTNTSVHASKAKQKQS